MVTSNKDAARIWAEIEKARAVGTEVTVEDAKNLNNAPDRGPNDLEERIEDLMKIELSHRNLNAELRKNLNIKQIRLSFTNYVHNSWRRRTKSSEEWVLTLLTSIETKVICSVCKTSPTVFG